MRFGFDPPIATKTLSPQFRIIAVRWFDSKLGRIGAVLILTHTKGFKVYVGIPMSGEETVDAADIAINGTMLDYEAGYGLFSDEMIAAVYSATAGKEYRLKYDGELYESLYNKAQPR